MNTQTTVGEECRQLYADALDPDAFLRSTGEAVARRDAAWKNAHNLHLDVSGPIADFVKVGIVHLDAMSMAGLKRQSLATMLSMLITVDMSKADVGLFGSDFLELHRRFLLACSQFANAAAEDAFAAPHARAILAMEAVLYLAAYGTYGAEGGDNPELAGLAEAARRLISAGTLDDSGAIVPDPASPAEALIDMFSRLHAVGLDD